MDSFLHVALAFDENFAMPCGITIVSICENTPCDIFFHVIIADDVTDKSKNKILDIVKKYHKHIRFYNIDEMLFKNLPETSYITKSTYFRLLLPQIIPIDINKIIYLDSDLVALKSIKSLWEFELEEDTPAAMAIDGNCSNVTFHNFTELPLEQPYYNAGVIVMNLSCWRKENIGIKCISLITEKKYRYMDQDALNVLIGKRIKQLHLKYNLQIEFLLSKETYWKVDRSLYFEQVHEAINAPVIIHYAHPDYKPWYKYTYYNDHWLRFKAKSPWKDYSLCKSNKSYLYINALHSELNKINPNSTDYKNKHSIVFWLAGELMRVTCGLLRYCNKEY